LNVPPLLPIILFSSCQNFVYKYFVPGPNKSVLNWTQVSVTPLLKLNQTAQNYGDKITIAAYNTAAWAGSMSQNPV